MIKKFIMMGLLCLFSVSVNAQKKLKITITSKNDKEVSPVVKEKVEEYVSKINQVIQEEKKQMETELETLKEDHLEKSDFNKKKTEIADRYAEKIDKRIEDLGFDLDAIVQKQVKYSLLNSDVVSDEELKNQLLFKFRPTKNFAGYLSYGVMTLTNDRADNDLDKNLGYSNNLEFGLKFNYQLSRTSPWGITSGLGFSWRTVRLDNNMVFAKSADNGVYLEKYTGSLDKSKLRTGYVMVPLGVQYNFSKLKNAGLDVKYRPYSEGFRIGVNVYGGIKMSSNNIIKGDGQNFRERSDYQVNPLVYGAQFTVAYDNLSLFVKKDFSNFFKDGYFSNDKALVFGVAVGW